MVVDKLIKKKLATLESAIEAAKEKARKKPSGEDIAELKARWRKEWEAERQQAEQEARRQEYFKSRQRIQESENKAMCDLINEWLAQKGESPRRLRIDELAEFNKDMRGRVNAVMDSAQMAMNRLKPGF